MCDGSLPQSGGLGSGISLAVTIAGPSGQNGGKLFASDHWDVAIWTSRALTSLTMIQASFIAAMVGTQTH